MAKQIVTDEVSILKRQARRRLLGAIALTLLVVVLLPMVLDNKPSALSPPQDINLQIPDKDKAGEFVPKMVLPPLSAAATQPASAPVIAPLLDIKPVSAVVAQATIASKPVIEVNPVVASKPVIEAKPKAEQKIEQAETKSKLEAKPSPKAASNTHSGFIIQVGAFGNADAAKNLQEKLHGQGYPSYTEKVGGTTRVRIGDYTSHAEAEKVRRKLEMQDYKPHVINLN